MEADSASGMPSGMDDVAGVIDKAGSAPPA